MGGSNCWAEAAVESASAVTAAIANRVFIMLTGRRDHPDYQDS
jgi:hypothetical protein